MTPALRRWWYTGRRDRRKNTATVLVCMDGTRVVSLGLKGHAGGVRCEWVIDRRC